MTKKRYPLLKAVEHNWDLIGPGDWVKVKWLIFSDGFYEVVSIFNPSFYDIEIPRPVKKKTSGQMGVWAFSKLRKALKRKPWRNPSLEVCTFDGVAWKMKSYREDGSIDKTSGKLDYIYGHKNLERIVRLLPSDGNIYDSNAYISVEKKR